MDSYDGLHSRATATVCLLCLVVLVMTSGCNLLQPTGSGSPTPTADSPEQRCTPVGNRTVATPPQTPTPTGHAQPPLNDTVLLTKIPDHALAVVQGHNSGYVVTGQVKDDLRIVKVTESVRMVWQDDRRSVNATKSGQIVWTRRFGGNGSDIGHEIVQAADGGYVVAGTTNSFTEERAVWLVKVNATGHHVWNRTLGSTTKWPPLAIEQTADDGFIVAGDKVTKIDAHGRVEWTHHYLFFERLTGITQTPDGGFAVIGDLGRRAEQSRVIKVNQTGTLQWCRILTEADETTDIIATHDGGIAVTGSWGDGVGLWKLRSAGTLEWKGKYHRGGPGVELVQTQDGDFVITANVYGTVLINIAENGKKRWTGDFGRYGSDGFARGHHRGYVIAGRSDGIVLNYIGGVLIKATESEQTPASSTPTSESAS